ncbi:MAG TPA: PEGA domain-containing protein [Polyangiaceae bacterium]|nr:PEGA domain-containing protein [Polyangiaceae bacterium]
MRRYVIPFWLVLCAWALPAAAQAPAAASTPPVASTPAPAPVAATPAASDVARAKESFRIGAAAYAAGEYLAAIAALDSAYAAAPLPAIAFSLAQAERRQYFVDQKPEHLQRSVALFRRYLEQTPSGGRRTDALEALAQLEPLAQRVPAAAPAGAPSAAPSTRLLVIAEAPGARVFIDGEEAGTPIREVAPGEHRVVVRAPGFRDAERVVVAVAGELIPVSVALDELPGVVEVQASKNAEIYVDGAFAALGGDGVALALPSGSHRLSVAQNGHRVASRTVEVQRGSRQALSVELEPTAQRMTSNVLLIGGGAVVGAGVFLGVLAVQSEDAAQTFIEQSAIRNVSSAELVRYQADVARRDRYRVMAGVSLAAGLGLLVTGLFLHELDQPRAEELGGVQLDADVGPGFGIARLRGAF